jgi:hypothetical protein
MAPCQLVVVQGLQPGAELLPAAMLLEGQPAPQLEVGSWRVAPVKVLVELPPCHAARAKGPMCGQLLQLTAAL